MSLRTEVITPPSTSDIITIVGGMFTQRVEEGTKGAIPRKLTKGKNEGKEVHELKFPALSGMLMGAEITESKFGGQDGTIHLKDFKTDEEFTVSTGADNGMFTDFIKVLPNIDTNQEIVFQMDAKKGSKTDANGNVLRHLRIFQNGRVVKSYFEEYDNQERKFVCIHEMPAWEKTPKGWNHDDQDFFLWDYLSKFIENYTAPTGDPAIRDMEAPNPTVEEKPNRINEPNCASPMTEAELPDIPF